MAMLKHPKQLQTHFEESLDSWNTFDVFAVDELSGGSPLLHTAFAIFQRRGLITTFNLDPTKLVNFLTAAEATYKKANPCVLNHLNPKP